MSKGSRTTSGPSRFSQPFIREGANTLQGAYNANSGQIQDATNQVLGLLPDMIQRYQDGDAGTNAARDYNVDVLSGMYLDQGNPYLDDIISRSNDDIRNQTQAAMGVRGLTGGSDYAGLIADRVAGNTLGLRYSDYNNERSRMATAAGQSPSIAASDYLSISPILGAQQASMLPVNAAGTYAGGLGGLLGGYGTQSQSPGAGQTIGNLAQMGAMFALASERRVKRDIEQIGTLPDGLNVYNFRYVWDEDDAPLHTGVMVDEVEELRPWALGPVIDGIQTVDYSKLETAQ